jgi:general secretion pathway protein G
LRFEGLVDVAKAWKDNALTAGLKVAFMRRSIPRETKGGSVGRSERGFTLVELLTVIAVIGVLSTLAVGKYAEVIRQAKIARAIGDIKAIQTDLQAIEAEDKPLPASLALIGRGAVLDPWGRPYVYNPFPPGAGVPPGARRDRFLVPLNSTFDLYSMGEDGQSVPPLNATKSRDDVIRANDGGFIGLAKKY